MIKSEAFAGVLVRSWLMLWSGSGRPLTDLSESAKQFPRAMNIKEISHGDETSSGGSVTDGQSAGGCRSSAGG
ncbi:hypothetical protein LBMAG46_39490 [Planctomycetia bacterium]|nr:hypothetical protein LBMAG46_39490 [Planctomycetia bacterium]